jgi:tetratricopeptide (TPR) repeat protein
LILDNLCDVEENPLLPSWYEGTILITTQKHTLHSQEISVGNMSEKNSIKLFLQTAHEKDTTEEERQQVRDAVNLLDRLPIAVSAAGCLIRYYATMPLLAKVQKFIKDFRDGKHHGFERVWRVFNLSIVTILSSLPRQDLGIIQEDVWDILHFLANLDSGNLSSDVLRSIYHSLQGNIDKLSPWEKSHLFGVFTRDTARIWMDHRIHRLLSLLAQYNLIALNVDANNESRFKCSMHYIVQRWLLRIQQRESQASPSDMHSISPATWNKAAVTLAQSISWQKNADDLEYGDRRFVVPHIIALLKVGESSQAKRKFFHNYEGSYFHEARELRSKTEQALKSTGLATPELKLLYSKARRELASCEGELGDIKRAIQLVTEVLKDSLREVNMNDDEILMAKADLASYYHVLGERSEELRLRQEVLDGYKIIKSKDDETILEAMRMLASTLYSLGRRPEAYRIRQEVYEIRKTLEGRPRLKMLQLESDLAESLSEEGWWLKSLEIRKRIVDEAKKAWGHCRHLILLAMTRLATGYSQAKMKDEARDLRRETLALHKGYYGEEHHGTLEAMEHLASSEAELGNLEEALSLQNQVVKFQMRKYAEESHRQVLLAKDKLGSLLFRHGNWEQKRQGLKLKRKVLEYRRQKLGPEHRETLIAMERLAICLDKLGKSEDSARLRRKLVILRSRHLKTGDGKVHPETLRAVMALADNYDKLYHKQREQSQGVRHRQCFRRSIDMQKPFNQYEWWDSEIFEDLVDKIGRHDVISGHGDLAVIAFHIRKSVQRHVEDTFGPKHRVTLELKTQISDCEACAKQTMKAIEILTEVVAILEQQRGKDDAEVARLRKLRREHMQYLGINDEEHESVPLAGLRSWRHKVVLVGASLLRCIKYLCCR